MVEKRPFYRSGIFYILSGILLIVVAGIIVWRFYKYKLVNKKLDQLVTTHSKGLYKISYQKLVIDEASGSIAAENVELLPDSVIFQTMIDKNTDPGNLFYIKIPKLLINGIKTPKALLTKELSAHIVRIESPEIIIAVTSGKKSKRFDFGEYARGDMYRQLLGNFKSITADSVMVDNASLVLIDKKSKQIQIKATKVSLRFTGVSIDSIRNNDSSRILFSRDIGVYCGKMDLPGGPKEYTFQLSGFDFNTQTHSIHTGEIRIKPELSEAAFARANKYATDRLDFRIGSLELLHIDRNEFLMGIVKADTLKLTGASFRSFRDKSYPQDSVDRTKKYPHQAIMKLPVQVDIRTLLVPDAYVEYKEKSKQSDSSGRVAFYHVQAKFRHVTNILSSIKRNPIMSLDFRSSFLNETPFTVLLKMKLNDPDGHFTLDASLQPIDAVLLNPLLKPMGLVELDRGKIEGLQYHLEATDTKGQGRLTLIYHDVKLKILKKNKDKNTYQAKVLPTLASRIVLKESNPKNGHTRIGEVEYKRDKYRSIFNMMWRSMFAAIKKVAL
ncbi:MAG: hypothetical protein M3N30_11860 [Bacteroidota bacterium]|nr:hypothetical protein [Bacteroidota bacterium]